MKSCDWCGDNFAPNVSYQIYCTPACRELATRKKIYDRYKKIKVADRSKKDRLCSGGCKTILSVYNSNTFCNVCMVNKNKVEKMIEDLKGLFDYEQE